MPTNDLLHYASLTSIVTEIKPPQRFLQSLLFPVHESKPTDKIEIGVEFDGREMAPFVTKNGEAVQVSGTDEKFLTFEAPNIRIKRPMTASDLLERRHVGTPIFQQSQAGILRAARRHVRNQMEKQEILVVNRIEWLCAMAIRGQISYTNPDLANFTITFQKPAGHTIILAGTALWTDPASNPRSQFRQAKKLVADEHGLSVTHCIMGEEAATAFLSNPTVLAQLDNRRFDMDSELSANGGFSPEGAQFLGTFNGVRCWEYSRQLEGQDLIRPKFAEFVVAGRNNGNVLYFGAITDMDAFEGQALVGERFAKSWIKKDPSVRMSLLTSRPLPVTRRPGSTVSMQVVA